MHCSSCECTQRESRHARLRLDDAEGIVRREGHVLGADGTVGIEEAARACGVSDETIRRRLRAGRLPGAHRFGGVVSAWRIPIGDLVADGFTPLIDTSGTGASSADREATDLRVALAEARTAAEERLARIVQLEANLADLRSVLVVLERAK